jgi:hypothetical protein
MANIECRKLTVLTIVNILVNTTQGIRKLKSSIKEQEERLELLEEDLFNVENFVVEYLHNLEDLVAGQFCPV